MSTSTTCNWELTKARIDEILSPPPMAEHVDRNSYIGGGDAAALCGVSDWGNPLSVWLKKTGRESVPTSERMTWGLLLEEQVLTEFGLRTGLVVLPGEFIRSKGEPWCGGHCDGFAVDRECMADDPYKIATLAKPFGRRLLEAKVIGGKDALREWEREVPMTYQYQAQHYLDLWGLQLCTFVVLFGGAELRCFDVAADPMIQHQIRVEAERFWRQNIERQVPPSAAAIAMDAKQHKHPKGPAPIPVRLMAGASERVLELADIREGISRLESLKDAITNDLKAELAMTGAQEVQADDGTTLCGWITKQMQAQPAKPASTRTEFRVAASNILRAALAPKPETT